jgi:hypothetical protein
VRQAEVTKPASALLFSECMSSSGGSMSSSRTTSRACEGTSTVCNIASAPVPSSYAIKHPRDDPRSSHSTRTQHSIAESPLKPSPLDASPDGHQPKVVPEIPRVECTSELLWRPRESSHVLLLHQLHHPLGLVAGEGDFGVGIGEGQGPRRDDVPPAVDSEIGEEVALASSSCTEGEGR